MKSKRLLIVLFIFSLISCNVTTSQIKEAIKINDIETLNKYVSRNIIFDDIDNPISVAIKENNKEALALLLENDSLREKYNPSNDLSDILLTKNWDILKILLNKGIDSCSLISEDEIPFLLDFLVKYPNDNAMIKLLINNYRNINTIYDKWPILHYAIVHCDEEIIDSFLQNGADIELKKSDGENALDVALCQQKIDIIYLLIDKGAKIYDLTDPKSDPWSILADNWTDDYKEIAEMFLKKGIPVDSESFFGLHTAVINGNYWLVKFLLENGADPNKADGDGKVPIDYSFFIVSSPMGVTPQEDYEKANEIIDILMKYGSKGPDFLKPLVQ